MALDIKTKFCNPAGRPRSPDSCWSWFVCLAGTLTWALSFGISQCYAVPMPVIMDHFNSSREATAWAGSIPGYLTFAGIPLCSKLVAIINIRFGSLLGAAMCVVSLILTSFTTSLLQIFFSFSIIYGLGCSMIYTSCILAMTQYFKKRQGLAIGIFTGGLNLGVLSLGPLLQFLLDVYGLRWMFRIMAFPFIVVILLLFSLDPNVKKDMIRTEGEEGQEEVKSVSFSKGVREVIKLPQYTIAVISLTMQTLTAFVSFVHLINYCKEAGIPPSKSASLFIPIGITSLLSSVITGRVLDFPSLNPLHINQAGSLSLALSMLLVQLATEYYHFVIYSIFLGLGIGVLVTTIVALLLKTVEPRLRSVSFPFGQLFTSIGNLTGPPFIGFIADRAGSYKPAFFTAGGICLLAFFLPFLQYCFKPWKKAVRAKEMECGENPGAVKAEEVSLNSVSDNEEGKLIESVTIPKEGQNEKVDDKKKTESLETDYDVANETTPLNSEEVENEKEKNKENEGEQKIQLSSETTEGEENEKNNVNP